MLNNNNNEFNVLHLSTSDKSENIEIKDFKSAYDIFFKGLNACHECFSESTSISKESTN